MRGAVPAAPATGKAATKKGSNPTANAPTTAAVPPAQDATSAQANDGFLINGSVNNAATSQFSLNQAFGNNRNGGHGLYNYGARLILDSSFLDAKQFAVAGENVEKPSYLNLVGGVTWGGPLKIGHWLPLSRAPNFYLDYQRTQNKTDTTNSALFPTAAEIGGNLTGLPGVTTIYVPKSGLSAGCLATPGVTPGGTFAGTLFRRRASAASRRHYSRSIQRPMSPAMLFTTTRFRWRATPTRTRTGAAAEADWQQEQVNGNFYVTDSRRAPQRLRVSGHQQVAEHRA